MAAARYARAFAKYCRAEARLYIKTKSVGKAKSVRLQAGEGVMVLPVKNSGSKISHSTRVTMVHGR